MSYPGNETLTQEMQERILSTFRQTLSAAAAGNRKEALLGCDFILRLDSLFGPARQLHERLESGEGPVEVADLGSLIGFTPEAPEAPAAESPPAAPQPPAIDELDDLDLDAALAESDAETAPEAPAAVAVAPEPAAPEPPAPQPAAAAPAPPAPEPPAAPIADQLPSLDELDDLAVEAPPSGAAARAEAPAQVAAAPPLPPAAEVPPAVSPPEPPSIPSLDELDGLEPGGGEEGMSATPDDLATPATLEELATPATPDDLATPATLEELATPATPDDLAAPPAPPAAEAAPAPEAPATPGAAGAIPLTAEPAAQLDAESQQRIDDLLTEGQQAFDAGEYQGAIDAWSRIFLIDIDHAEANRRIEEARKLKAEADRKVEEKFHEGVAHLESGDADAAAESFRAVLAMHSSHLAARDYLEKLEAGEMPVPELPKPAEGEEEPSPAGLEVPDVDMAQELGEEAEEALDRGKKAVGPRMVSVKKSPLKNKAFLAVAAAGLIAVLGGAWYLFNNWSTLFPNSAQEAPAAARPDPVSRAKGLHEQGKTPIAIAQLRRLPPGSPQYDEAQALIAQWELEQGPPDAAAEGPSPAELARRNALIAEASSAADQREFMRTSELLSEAAAIAPLRGAEVQLLARADEQLQELQNFITFFREGEWDFALRDLWLLHESDPGNRDVTRLLVDSYYNLGVRDLQRSDPRAAVEQFREALELSADDLELQRLVSFAETYQTRSPDLLYRIFVKYVPFR